MTEPQDQNEVVNRRTVLVVDDEASIRDSLRLLLRANFDVITAENGAEAIALLQRLTPDLILMDVMMPVLGGIEALKEMRENKIDIPVIMLTATSTVKTAVQAMKLGAVDYLNKPFEIEELTTLLIKTLGDRQAIRSTISVESAKTPDIVGDFGSLVGQSSSMKGLFDQIKVIAPRDTTVLITGESGTGKEMVAKSLHDISARAGKPFIAINCAAIPESLIESELFGHEKGAFTHAHEKRIGHFEQADNGTLFLDEIGELSLNVQVKMLRFLQEQEFYRVGRSKPIKVDVRIIAATNKNLEDLIREKKFREDLYYRIHVVHLTLPALRDRYEDIPLLVSHFSRKLAPQYGGKSIYFTPEAMESLVEYNWPGNVRELENVIESLLALSSDDRIDRGDLPAKITDCKRTEIFKPQVLEGGVQFEAAEREFEREIILKALKKTNFIQTRAAVLLGISRRILKYKMDKLGIVDPNAGKDLDLSDDGSEEANHEN